MNQYSYDEIAKAYQMRRESEAIIQSSKNCIWNSCCQTLFKADKALTAEEIAFKTFGDCRLSSYISHTFGCSYTFIRFEVDKKIQTGHLCSNSIFVHDTFVNKNGKELHLTRKLKTYWIE